VFWVQERHARTSAKYYWVSRKRGPLPGPGCISVSVYARDLASALFQKKRKKEKGFHYALVRLVGDVLFQGLIPRFQSMNLKTWLSR
jgi:hypothetical protein